MKIKFRKVLNKRNKPQDGVFYFSECGFLLLSCLKSMGISDVSLDTFGSFLENKFQRVDLNGQTSEWLPVKADVPQRSILGSLLFSNLY